MLEIKDFYDFSINTWYEKFKTICLKTIIIPIPLELLDKFKSGTSDINIKEICSDEYISQLKNSICQLDNNVFVKNNWHAPIDAKFISFGNTLKVSNIDDLILYMSVSDLITSDFNSCHNIPFCFALKPWISIHPASEFRCIVINNILRGITPRDWPTYYAHFCEEGQNIIKILSEFYTNNIKDKFIRNNYIFDIVISYPENVILIDFGPLNNKTNLFAFGWSEIQSVIQKNCMEEVAPVFRYLERDVGIMTKTDAFTIS